MREAERLCTRDHGESVPCDISTGMVSGLDNQALNRRVHHVILTNWHVFSTTISFKICSPCLDTTVTLDKLRTTSIQALYTLIDSLTSDFFCPMETEVITLLFPHINQHQVPASILIPSLPTSLSNPNTPP